MDRKYSDPTIWDNSIDHDDEPDGSDGGYTKHGSFIVAPAMRELVRLRAENEALRRYANHTNDCNLSSIYQFVALRGCNCGFDALAAKGEKNDV